jgi:Leucine Rich repeats (2 copies)
VTLTLGPPPPELARELEQVRARAQGLAAYIQSANAPFPEDFPKADILAVTAEMAELPDGTAQGSLPPLEYADMRLADIRSLHFPAIDPAHALKGDQHPALTREEGLDRDLSGLMVAIATARRVANRIAAIEPEEKSPEPSMPREGLSDLAEIESKGLRVSDELLEARHDFDEVALPTSEPADHFRRTLTDAKVVAGLSRVELAQQNIIPAWLRRFGAWLSDYPARLEHAGQALELGIDIAETVHGGWRKFKKKLTDVAYSSLREFADDLQGLGRRLDQRRRTTAQGETFAISKVKSKVLAGEEPPIEWVQFIDELDLSGTPLRDLSPLQVLTALRSLDLGGTQVTDLSPLKSMTGLQSLDLGGTQVTNLSPLKSITALQRLVLGGTQVSDLSPLNGMIALQRLDLGGTRDCQESCVRGRLRHHA